MNKPWVRVSATGTFTVLYALLGETSDCSVYLKNCVQVCRGMGTVGWVRHLCVIVRLMPDSFRLRVWRTAVAGRSSSESAT